MANYEESMFENQDDLIERAVAWLCQASEDAGESVGEWAATVGLVGDRLAEMAERRGRDRRPTGRHVAVVHVVLDDVDGLDADQMGEVLAKDLIDDGYDAYVVDIMVPS